MSAFESGLSPNISLFGFNTFSGETLSGQIASFGWFYYDALPSIINTNYCARNEQRLIEQFEEKPNLLGLLCSLVTPMQELEFVYQDLWNKRWLDTAEGEQLDGLGEIVGVSRNGKNDADYRIAIRFQIAVNMSNGEWETMLAVTKELTDATTVRIIEDFPAGIILLTDGANIPVGIIGMLEQSAPAGVRLTLYSTYLELPQFAYEIETSTPDPDGGGYAEPTETDSGGHYSEKIT